MKNYKMGKALLSLLLSVTLLFPVVVQAAEAVPVQAETVQVIRPYITGMETVGTELRGVYTYYDTQGRAESGTTFRWLRSDTKKGEYQAIPEQTGANYTLTAEDAGRYIRFEVTPRAAGQAGEPGASWMIGPVLTQAEYAQIDNRFDNGNDFMANVNSIQSDIAARMQGALYFTVDSGKLHGSDVLMKDNAKFDFEEATRPLVQNGVVYAPEGFFTDYLGASAPQVDSVTVNGKKYYNLKSAAAALGKQYWSGDENQSEIDNVQLEHLGQGLIVISGTEDIFDPVADRDLIDEACNQLYTLRATEEQMEWFRDAKYGMFMHWDPSSQLGVEISWDRKAFRPADVGGDKYQNVIDPEYDTLGKTFNPTDYNPDEWMQLAKDAGMKYVVLTAKHHGSYSNFFSDFDNHTIEYSPYGQDIVGKYVAAAKKAGLKVGLYYSPRDWYNPNYLTDDHHRYLEYYFGQIQELMSNYGDIDIMWFDSIGNSSLNQWDPRTLLRRMKQLNPNVIINNRYTAVLAQYERSPYDINGDWYTPEHRLGGFDSSRPWESCMTVTEAPGGGWSYRPDGTIKSVEESVKYLINNVVNDGNLLYNIGPMPDGKLKKEHADVFREVGEWLKPYGEAVYNTRGGPYRNPRWGGSTYRVNEDGTQTIYLHVSPLLKNYSPEGNTLQIDDPGNGQAYNSASLVKDGKAVTLEHNGSGILLTLPAGESWDAYDTVIKLDADVGVTLRAKTAEVKAYANGLTGELIGTVRESLLDAIAEAERVLQEGDSQAYSSALLRLTNEFERAGSAAELVKVIAQAEQKLASAAVGTKPWECPQSLYDSLQSKVASAKLLFGDSETSKEQFDQSGTGLSATVGSFDEIMRSVAISISPEKGTVENGTKCRLSSQFEQLDIHYTLDGSEPTIDSATYDGEEIAIPAGVMTVKAALFEGTLKVGATNVKTYLNNPGATNIATSNTSCVGSTNYSDSFRGSNACDGNGTTRWATPDGTITATLELTFAEPKSFNTAVINEYLSTGETTRISDFSIETWDGEAGDWKECYTGTAGGAGCVCAFETVTANRVRLNLKGCMNVTIWEFSLFHIDDSVSVAASQTSLRPGETSQLTIAGQYANGTPIPPEKILNTAYHTDHEDLVSIDENGLLSLKPFEEDFTFHVWANVTVGGKAIQTESLAFEASRFGENFALEKTASASSVYNQSYPASNAVDGNPRTRWASQAGQSAYWLEVNLGQTRKINNVKFQVYSDKGDPVNYEVFTDFKLQYYQNGSWVDAYDSSAGTHTIVYPHYDGSEQYSGGVWTDSSGIVKQTDYLVNFAAVETDRIRLYSDNCKKDPSLFEFGAYNTGVQTVNTAALEAAITKAAAYAGKQSEYTAESWKAFDDAEKAAKAALTSTDQTVINNATTGLTNAIKALEPVSAAIDTAALEAAITKAAAYAGKQSEYTAESWKAFDDAEKAAKAALTSKDQTVINNAAAGLTNAIKALEPVSAAIDTAALEAAITKAAAYAGKQSEYTAESWKAFDDAEKAAKAALTSKDQTVIDNATTGLTNAMGGLRAKADKSLLNKVIAGVKALDLSDYTAESVEKLNAALDTAKTAANNENLSTDDQQAVDNALNELKKAISGLVRKDGTEANAGVDEDGNITGVTDSPKTGRTSPVALEMTALLLAGSLLLIKKRKFQGTAE